jgi:antitoxin (DNA-binding transcriptional repressor) of toxin-antitoxin stability system
VGKPIQQGPSILALILFCNLFTINKWVDPIRVHQPPMRNDSGLDLVWVGTTVPTGSHTDPRIKRLDLRRRPNGHFTHAEVYLTASCLMILLSIMKTKTATVADLRNNFRRVSAWLENGESVEIVKRGRRFARLVPAAATSLDMLIKVDFAAQLRAVWGQKVFSDGEIEAMREAELGTQS